VIIQYDIEGKVEAEIYEDGKKYINKIVSITGNKKNIPLEVKYLFAEIKNLEQNSIEDPKFDKLIKKDCEGIVKQLSQEVRDFNEGKNTKITKGRRIDINKKRPKGERPKKKTDREKVKDESKGKGDQDKNQSRKNLPYEVEDKNGNSIFVKKANMKDVYKINPNNLEKIAGSNNNLDPKKMYVRISPIAYVYAGMSNSAMPLKEYLKNNVGKYIEVETDFLFNDQYNTATGYRIYDTMIDRIVHYKRIGIKKFEQDETCAFLHWKGIKPIPKQVEKKQFGTYSIEANILGEYRVWNLRNTYRFLFFQGFFYVSSGIGYRKTSTLKHWGNKVPSKISTQIKKYIEFSPAHLNGK
jgi:hypothetical protein